MGLGWWWKEGLRGRGKIVSQFLMMYAHLINHFESLKSLLIQTVELFCVSNTKDVYEIWFWKHNKGSQHVSCPVSHTRVHFVFRFAAGNTCLAKMKLQECLNIRRNLFGEKSILVGEIMEFLADLLFFPLRHSER